LMNTLSSGTHVMLTFHSSQLFLARKARWLIYGFRSTFIHTWELLPFRFVFAFMKLSVVLVHREVKLDWRYFVVPLIFGLITHIKLIGYPCFQYQCYTSFSQNRLLHLLSLHFTVYRIHFAHHRLCLPQNLSKLLYINHQV
jgi:hypothetical protein